MNPCDVYQQKALRYLDNDLSGQEREDFRAHLEGCATCQSQLEAERALSHVLQQARPLFRAPAALRARVAAAAGEPSAAARVSVGTGGRVRQLIALRLSGAVQRASILRVAIAALIIALGLAFVPITVRHVRAASYVESALATHRSYVNGDLPPGLQSSSPELVTAWFAEKVPFQFRLPNARSIDGAEPAYRMTGARLVDYKGGPAALVTYQTQHEEKISLLIASSKSAVVAGGEQVRFGKLTFHYRNDASFRVITWSNHGLSYALVSSVSGSPKESCLVCHQNMADHADFRTAR